MATNPLAHIISKFVLDGKSYEVEDFKVSFSQSVDYKGQPQHEILGGQLFVKLHEAADDSLYLWAKKSTQLKSGAILFQSDIGMTVLEIIFTDAYCINLTREINAYTGTSTSLVLSPKELRMDGIKHENYWKK
ncbi:hypothetical protein FACS189426_02040 [Bacteroidia bacterium]|nr:hypothetical protein FACS189426_02040 [Bacteroidia bacterium]